MRQAENRGDFLSVDEVVDVDPASHADTVHRLAAEPYERTLSVRRIQYLPHVTNKAAPAVGKHPGAWPAPE
jgi:hypothetical protein